MNILHHKSWHVYNKDNIERVRKDEAEAEAEAKKKQDRVIFAESEARLDLLRKRANANLPIADNTEDVKRIEHINLFQDLQDEHSTKNTNPEHEAEQKAKDEKWERQITMYLDKGTQKDPWYATPSHQRDEKYIDKHVFRKNHKKDDNPHRRNRQPFEISDDPLDYITKTLEKRQKKHSTTSDKKKKKQSHSHSHSHSHPHAKPSETSTTSIQELRAKRLERERDEQSRLRLLYLHDNETQEEKVELDDRKRGYNSQFNRDETAKAQEHRKKKLQSHHHHHQQQQQQQQ